MEKKTAIIILGMHRSGTSALAGSIFQYGISFGNQLINSAHDNEKGFFENPKILKFNNSLLNQINISWQTPFFQKEKIEETIESSENINELTKIIEEEFNEQEIFCIKDPRISYLAGLYNKVFENLEIDVKYIIQKRAFKATYISLKKRNNFSLNKTQILWLSYYLNAEFLTRNKSRVISIYKDLLDNPTKELKKIFADINVDLSQFENSDKKIKAFIAKNLNHAKNNRSAIGKGYFDVRLVSVNTLLNELKENKEKPDSNFDKLDKTYEKLSVLSAAFYEELIYTKTPFLQYRLFDKDGSKILEKTIEINNNLISLDVDLSKIKGAQKILIYPCSEYSYFSLLDAKFDSEQVRYNSTRNIIEHGINFITNNSDYLEYIFPEESEVKKFELEIEYKCYGLNALDKVRFVNNLVNDWFYEKLKTEKEEKEDAVFQLEKLKNSRIINTEASQKELSALQSTINDFGSKEESFNQQIAVLNEKLKLKDEQLRLKTDSHQITSPLISEQISQLENQKLENLLSLKEYEIKSHYHQKEIDDKNNSIVSFQEKLTKAEHENVELLTKINQLNLNSNESENNIKELRSEIKTLNNEFKEILNEKEELINSKKALSSELNEFKDQLKEQVNIIKSLQEKLNAKDQTFADLEEKLKTKDKTIANFEESLNAKQSEIDAQLNAKQSEIEESLNAKQNEFEEVLKTKQSDLENIEEKYNYLATIYEELNQKEIEAREENENNKNSLQIKQQQLSKFETDNTSLKDEVYNLKNEIAVLNEVITNYHDRVLKLNNLKNQLLKDIKDLKSSVSYKIGFGATWPARFLHDVKNKKANNQNNLNMLLAILASENDNPSQFLKSIGPDKMSLLSKALQKNDPATVAKNINKYISTTNNSLPESKESIQLESNVTKDAVSIAETVPSKLDDEVDKPKILYISPNLPDFDTSSGGKRATRMIGLLSEEFDVYCFTLGAKPEKYINKLESLGAYVVKGFSFKELRKKISNFHTIIFSFYYTYYDYNKFIALFPNSKIIIDSVDVHWVREERSIGLWDQLTPEKVEKNKKREIHAYGQADFIWAVTENDKQFILNEVPKANVKVVSNVHTPILTSYKDSNTNNMLFIGGYNHYPNISAVKLVATKILPRVLKAIPNASLVIAGANAPDDVIALSKLPNVTYKGFIKEEEMDDLYDKTFISVCPVLAGAGIKGKVCEAISYMTPVATNVLGNEGVNLVNLESGIINDDHEKLADDIITFMKREVNLSAIATKAQENLYNLVGPKVVKKRMMSSILPEVSICIVTWNRIDLLKRCIESIEGNTKYPNYKILVHSNGCEDGTQAYLEAASKVNSKIVPILSKDNEVFVIPNNNMAAMFPDNDVILLNNDTYVTEGWLYALFDAAYSSTEIGLSGSKILYPDGRLQEFGSELYENGTGKNIGKFDDPNKEEYKTIKRVGYVSGCSLYVKRSTINKIGLFDLQFHPCYCEDSDLCYTAWENDLQTVVTPYSIIYHDEGGTSGTDEEKGFKAYQKVNFEKFLNKHKSKLGEIQKKIESLN